MLPCFELLGWYLKFRIHPHDLLRIGAELGEEFAWFVVLVLPAKPLLVHYFLYSRDGLDLLFVIAWQIEDQRHLVANDQALCRLFVRLAVIKAAPDGDQEREQKQRAADAEDGQYAAAFVAEGVLGDKTGQRHR